MKISRDPYGFHSLQERFSAKSMGIGLENAGATFEERRR
jgi:hypothetical protein